MAAKDNTESVVYLHGDLHLRILEARALPNIDVMTSRIRRCFTAFDDCRKPQNHGHRHRKIATIDHYITVTLGGATVARTRVISSSQNPVWDARFLLPLAHPASEVEFQVKDNNIFGADLIGVAAVPTDRIISGEFIDEWFPIVGSNGKPPKPISAVRLEMRFRYFNANPTDFPHAPNNAHTSVPLDRFDVTQSYFPIGHGGKLTLYQDAHVPDGVLPGIELDDGMMFKQEKCWEDICHAILEAHHLVYIIGWSIYQGEVGERAEQGCAEWWGFDAWVVVEV